MKMTRHKTAAMFHRYNTVDMQDAQEAYRKLEEYMGQEQREGGPRFRGPGPKSAPIVLPDKKRG